MQNLQKENKTLKERLKQFERNEEALLGRIHDLVCLCKNFKSRGNFIFSFFLKDNDVTIKEEAVKQLHFSNSQSLQLFEIYQIYEIKNSFYYSLYTFIKQADRFNF